MAAALMTPSLHGQFDMISLNGSMEDAISLLQFYAQRRSAAKRCLITLTVILQSQYHQHSQAQDTSLSLDSSSTGSVQQPQQHFAEERNDYGLHTLGWSLTAEEIQDAAVFGHFSDTWLTQPPMVNLDFLGM